MAQPKFQTPSGMHDVLPEDFRFHEMIVDTAQEIAEAYGFGRIVTPALEQEELFTQGVGQATDIVEKEMYTLRTRGGDTLALRPEGTAPVVRAYIEHGMKTWPQPVRLWYYESMFRHERPQAGRFRQFFQVGFEVLGEEDAVSDAEVVFMTMTTLSKLGLTGLALQVNSIGCTQCRPAYRKALSNYVRPRLHAFCADCKKRSKKNPLRVLDCKEERCQQLLNEAPETVDHLCDDCSTHFKEFLEFLEEMQMPYLLNTRLVRGLDYYSRTVFEVWQEDEMLARAEGEEVSKEKEQEGEEEKEGEEKEEKKKEAEKKKSSGSQLALASGGRYDPLFQVLGGKETGAGVGASIGIERVIESLAAASIAPPKIPEPQVFLVQLGAQAKRRLLMLHEELRRARFRVRSSLGKDSMKSQLRIADKVNAPYVVILGAKEILDGTVILRSMEEGTQETIDREKLIDILRDRLRGKRSRSKSAAKKTKPARELRRRGKASSKRKPPKRRKAKKKTKKTSKKRGSSKTKKSTKSSGKKKKSSRKQSKKKTSKRSSGTKKKAQKKKSTKKKKSSKKKK